MAKAKRRVCGANRKRGQGKCQSTRLYPNGRCRVHGGPTPSGPESANWKHGRDSKWGILPKGLAEHYQRAIGQSDASLMALTGEIALVDARVGEQLQAIGETGSAKLWTEARQRLEEFKTAIGQKKSVSGAREALLVLEAVLENGARASLTWDNLIVLLEQRRKLVETESKRRKDAQETLSIRQAMALVSFVAHAVREHVADPKARAGVFLALQKVLRPSPDATIDGDVVETTR